MLTNRHPENRQPKLHLKCQNKDEGKPKKKKKKEAKERDYTEETNTDNEEARLF